MENGSVEKKRMDDIFKKKKHEHKRDLEFMFSCLKCQLNEIEFKFNQLKENVEHIEKEYNDYKYCDEQINK